MQFVKSMGAPDFTEIQLIIEVKKRDREHIEQEWYDESYSATGMFGDPEQIT